MSLVVRHDRLRAQTVLEELLVLGGHARVVIGEDGDAFVDGFLDACEIERGLEPGFRDRFLFRGFERA